MIREGYHECNDERCICCGCFTNYIKMMDGSVYCEDCYDRKILSFWLNLGGN